MRIDSDLCIECGACEAVCPTDAVFNNDEDCYQIDQDKCTECGACDGICPVNACMNYDNCDCDDEEE